MIVDGSFCRSRKLRGNETYIDNDHLYVADDEDSVLVGLCDVDVAIRDSDGPSPAAVDSLGPANVVLRHATRERETTTAHCIV